jgi:hypothetical protein
MYCVTKKDGKPTPKARPLNLRDFPKDLFWRAKMCAAGKEMSFKSYIVAAVEAAVERDLPQVVKASTSG